MTDKTLKQNFISPENTIFIHDNFDEDIVRNILPVFDRLIEDESGKKKGLITIDIDSNGGYARYLQSLLMRVDIAKSKGIIVKTIVSAYAYSCGSMLACSGTNGHRFISSHAEHLCHLGSVGLSAINDKELERGSARIKAHFDFVRSIYKKNANIPELNKVIHDDCLFIQGQKIIDWGLADKFIEDNEPEPTTKNSVNVETFCKGLSYPALSQDEINKILTPQTPMNNKDIGSNKYKFTSE
tara:strand:- start:53021 stop:53743 length:723 start_codon:yes stop_codon:yes gene_type:complete